jgi:hypothetical protein
MHSLSQIVMGAYNTWTIYLAMEYIIRFSMQNGKEFSYKRIISIFEHSQYVKAQFFQFKFGSSARIAADVCVPAFFSMSSLT